MIRRFLPKSLLGQMLLAVALALLVAQALSLALLVRAEQNRTEAAMVNALAFQLIAEPRQAGERAAPRRPERPRRRIMRALESPAIVARLRDEGRENALRNVLENQGVAIGELVVLTRPALRDTQDVNGIPEPPLSRWQRGSEIAIAGLKSPGSNEWRIASTPRPPRARNAVRGAIVQTVILYVVIVGGLALLLRRITRPLAALTDRVERFGGTSNGLDPLEPSGPDDTRRLIEAHNAMEARIAALLDEKDVMLGAIGHDLKTPLAALRVRIESVEDVAERARMAASIEDITSSLDDILSLARVGRPSDPLEKTDLAALIASVVEEYEDMGEDVALADCERLAIPLRATWLRRALRNLIGNALRYGQQARVSLAREDGAAVIRIADTGPGIPDAQIADMLEPFTRGEASRNRETGGAGLGLTLARAIAEQHGGTLLLANRRGEDGMIAGLLAEIRLPISPASM